MGSFSVSKPLAAVLLAGCLALIASNVLLARRLSQLKQLDDPAALDLFRRGYLRLIYLMLASLNHVSVLAQRKNRSFLPGG